ncbi:MAG: RpiB/LacA/LacB family sugar-phosphate isomerase, partial [Candidatus Omnitrophica bacterium]|nr:RpiB/LacA/LacB family sugar-phosphate isomerase [Candidatus Omnitrophota bacterium]
MAGTVAIGADHGGYRLKQQLKALLKKKRYRIIDVGGFSDDPVDYPEYGYAAAKMVSGGKADKAVVICKSGIGMSIIANKVPGVRAALCGSVKDAESSRKHNDANVLVLGADRNSRAVSLEIADVWFRTRA